MLLDACLCYLDEIHDEYSIDGEEEVQEMFQSFIQELRGADLNEIADIVQEEIDQRV